MGLVLIVPSLMLVPGPHLINGLLDLIDNYLPMSIARLGLATAIVVASALGIVLGIELTLSEPPAVRQSFATDHLNLASDMILAAIVTCGFAMYYNAAWSQIGMAVLGGMAGHGVRFLALAAGCRMEIATFLGGLAVGIVAALIRPCLQSSVRRDRFCRRGHDDAGVADVPALSGVLQLAQPNFDAKQAAIASTLSNAAQASMVIGALALGLVLADRTMSLLKKPWN